MKGSTLIQLGALIAIGFVLALAGYYFIDAGRWTWARENRSINGVLGGGVLIAFGVARISRRWSKRHLVDQRLPIRRFIGVAASITAILGGVIVVHHTLSGGQAAASEVWFGIVALNVFMLLTIASSTNWLLKSIRERGEAIAPDSKGGKPNGSL